MSDVPLQTVAVAPETSADDFVEVRFTLTFDEYLEASGIHHSRQMAPRTKRRKRFRRAVWSIALVEAVFFLLWMPSLWFLVVRSMAPQLLRQLLGAFSAACLPIAPWVGLIVFSLLYSVAKRNPKRIGWTLGLPGLAFAMLGVLMFLLASLYEPAHFPAGNAVRFTGGTAPYTVGNFTGWGVFLFLWLFTAATAPSALRKMWNQQANLHRPTTVQFRRESFIQYDDLSRVSHLWSGIFKVVDKPSMLLIYANELMFHIIPKRAFADPAELDRCWAFIGDKGEARSQGFQVFAVNPPVVAKA